MEQIRQLILLDKLESDLITLRAEYAALSHLNSCYADPTRLKTEIIICDAKIEAIEQQIDDTYSIMDKAGILENHTNLKR